MAKDPAILWYWNDWNGGTITLSRYAKGCYMDLLHAQFNNGHLSDAEVRTVLGQDYGQYWPLLSKKFAMDSDGNYYNSRLNEEIARRKNFSLKQTANGKKGGRPKAKTKTKDNPTLNPNESLLENAIENENEFNSKKESLTKIDLFASLFDDELYVENLAKTHKGKSLNQAFEECYQHHIVKPNPPIELWEWKQKLNTWLSLTKSHGTNKTSIRRADATVEQARPFGEFK